MTELRVEWAYDQRFVSEDDGFTIQELQESGRIPVVRLSAVDEILAEAVWAMKRLKCEAEAALEPEELQDDLSYQRAQAFLASPAVAEWREREEGKKS